MFFYSLLLVGALCYVSFLCGRKKVKITPIADPKYRLVEHTDAYRTCRILTEKELMEHYVSTHTKAGVVLTLSRVTNG